VKKLTAFLLSLTMILSFTSCSLLEKEEEIEVPSKRDAQKAAEEKYDIDLTFVSEDISRHEDEAEWVFVYDGPDEYEITYDSVTWNSDHPDRFRFHEETEFIDYDEPIETSVPSPTSTPAPTPTTAPTEAPETPDYSAGDIVGDAYESEVFNMRIELPDGWRFATDREIAALGYAVSDLFNSEEYENFLENGLIALEFYMSGGTEGNINFNISSNNAGFTPEEYAANSVEAIESQLTGIIDVTYTSCETFVINGAQYNGLDLAGTVVGADISIYERQLYFVSDSGLVGTLTVAAYDEEGLDIIYDILSELS